MQSTCSTAGPRFNDGSGGGNRQGLDRQGFTIDEFCEAHRISRALYYKLRRLGLGPREMVVLSRRIISAEAAAEWRRAREAASSDSDAEVAAVAGQCDGHRSKPTDSSAKTIRRFSC
jgi:hypothetical protein